mmetsp:Transcript_7276/g.28636  ORF Transcript_7276/g.28636 Transcript_7276/m.28636 type:complete len:218 (-) Transcript_7276:3300-3953(-)
MAPEAPQQHHPGRHHHLRGLPRLPQVQHGHLRVLARSLRGRHRPRSPRILRASHPRRAHAASHQESGAHQGFPKLSEDPKVGSLRRGPHRVHQDGKQGSRRRQPGAQLREGRAERRRRRHPAPRRVRRREARAPWRGSRQPLRPGVDSRAPLPRPLPGRRRQARRRALGRGQLRLGGPDEARGSRHGEPRALPSDVQRGHRPRAHRLAQGRGGAPRR